MPLFKLVSLSISKSYLFHKNVKKATIDINKELINTYYQVKNNCEEMINQLDELQTQYKKQYCHKTK